MSIDYGLCPSHLRAGMRRWIENGVRPGGFLMTVLENDLAGAIGRADEESLAGILPLIQFLHGRAPGGAHGSPSKVDEWADKGGLAGLMGRGVIIMDNVHSLLTPDQIIDSLKEE